MGAVRIFYNEVIKRLLADEGNGVNHCSCAAGNGCKGNRLRRGGIDFDIRVSAVVGVGVKRVICAVNVDLGGVCFIFSNLDNYFRNVCGNGERESTNYGRRTKFDTGVTHCVVSRAVNLAHIRKRQGVTIFGIGLGSAKVITVNVFSIAVCAEFEYC